MQKIQGFTEQGNTTLTIVGATGTIARKVQGSFPACTVTVYLAGTITVASIYSDNALTAKANPFVAASDGTFFFYVPNGRYDIKFSGGGLLAPFTLGDFWVFDETSLVIDATAAPYFMSTSASASANATAYAAALAVAAAVKGILYVPAGTYAINGAGFAPSTGVTFRGAGSGATRFNYSGTGFLFDLGATALADDVGFEDFSVYCSGSALGPFQIGRTAQAYSSALLRNRWHFRNIYAEGSSTSLVGSYGISATEYINWRFDNVTLTNFRNAAIWNNGSHCMQTRPSYQGFAFGPKWSNTIGPPMDIIANGQFLGPTTTGTAGVDYGYTFESDAGNVTCIGCLYEAQPSSKSQGYVHITSLGSNFRDINGVFSNDGISRPDNPIVCDNGYYKPVFDETFCATGESALVFGTTLAPAIFLSVAHDLEILAAAAARAKATVISPVSATQFRLRTSNLLLDSDTANFSSTTEVQVAKRLVATTLTTFTDLDTTPTVAGANNFLANNSGATSITTFDDGVTNQRILVLCATGNTTFVNGANLKMKAGINYAAPTQAVIEFWTSNGTVWYEISRTEH